MRKTRQLGDYYESAVVSMKVTTMWEQAQYILRAIAIDKRLKHGEGQLGQIVRIDIP